MVGLYRSSAGQTITLPACCCQMYPHMANLCLESSKPFKTYHAVRNALPRDFPSLSSTAHGMIQVHTFNFFPGVQGNNTSRVFKKHVPSPGSEHCLLPQVVATGKANQNSPTPGDPGQHGAASNSPHLIVAFSPAR